MKKMAFLVMLMGMALMSCSTLKDLKVMESFYPEYKEQIISEVEEKLKSDGNKWIDLDYHARHIRSIFADKGIVFDNDVKYKKIYDYELDLRRTLSRYEQAVKENNFKYEQIQLVKAVFRRELYQKVKSKYGNIEWNTLTEKQKNEYINFFTKGRVIYKSEWDIYIATYGRSDVRITDNTFYLQGKGGTKEDFKKALEYMILQETLWHIGYIGRFTSDYEYQLQMSWIQDRRINLIIYVEENGFED